MSTILPNLNRQVGPLEPSAISHPFQDPGLPIESRLDDLLSLMTLDEKVECLGTNPSVPRLGVVASGHVEGLHGLAQDGPANWLPKRRIPTTTFPQSYGLGATWDPDLIRQVGAAEGLEARYIFQSPAYKQGGVVVRAPNADLGRDPRWGRTEECFGEDPLLAGALTAAFVRGVQGDHPTYWQAASLLKHFLANSNEKGREWTSSDMSERVWREYYSVPFRMGIVDGGSRAFMAAYNACNGIPCHVHPMLKEIAVAEWGQDGIICTDGGGCRLLVKGHKWFKTYAGAAAAVVRAGIGQFLDYFKPGVRQALKQGLLSEADIDSVLRGTFRVMIKLGLLDPPECVPYTKVGEGREPWLGEPHRRLARLVTRRSIVLLKNAGGLLPLDPRRVRSIAVVGPYADEVCIDWYSGLPPYRITPLAGIRDRVGAGVVVNHAPSGKAAVRAAAAAEVAIVVVGNHPTGNARWAVCERPSYGKEAVDRESLRLEDEALVRKVLSANPRTVVVLTASFPYAINWTQAHVPAILQMAHNSQEQGSALADVLFGDADPGGRLTQTWPRSVSQLPRMTDYDVTRGRTYMYFKGKPLYPFGFGLSYATYAYAGLRTDVDELGPSHAMRVTVDVANTGARDGEEVVQLYVRYLDTKVKRPRKQLRAFKRVAISAGKVVSVSMALAAKDLAYWDARRRRWTVETGRVELLVGRSAEAIELTKVIRVRGD